MLSHSNEGYSRLNFVYTHFADKNYIERGNDVLYDIILFVWFLNKNIKKLGFSKVF